MLQRPGKIAINSGIKICQWLADVHENQPCIGPGNNVLQILYTIIYIIIIYIIYNKYRYVLYYINI